MTDTVLAILTDLEGTIVSPSFSHLTLYPYARSHLHSFVRLHKDCSEIAEIIDSSASLLGTKDCEDLCDLLCESIGDPIPQLPMQYLLESIWEEGFLSGDLKAKIYGDVLETLQRLSAAGIDCYVYSRFPVKFQKLLLTHTTEGDLSGYFRSCFDRSLGDSSDSETYLRLSGFTNTRVSSLCFVSSDASLLEAAQGAGVGTCFIDRTRQAGGFSKVMLELYSDFSVHPESLAARLVANS